MMTPAQLPTIVGRLLLAAPLFLISVTNSAEVTMAASLPTITHLDVIYDTGKGLPVAPFVGAALKRLQQEDNHKPAPGIRNAPTTESLLHIPLHSRLTPGVQPHRALPDRVGEAMTQAAFIVGSDARSLDWLRQHHDYLMNRNAVGYVVEVPSLEALDQVFDAAGDLAITPVNLDSLSNTLGLVHYPVLITRNEGIRAGASDEELDFEVARKLKAQQERQQ